MLVALCVLAAVGTAAPSSACAGDLCLKIAEAVEALPPVGERERAQAAYEECRKDRAAGGDLLGVGDAHEECQEFVEAYRLARHYKQGAFSSAELCTTLAGFSCGQGLNADRKMGEHEECVARVSLALGNQDLGEALERACMEVPQHSAAAPGYCSKLANVMANASADGTVNAGLLCDKLLTGGNGTLGFDEEHFVYSCVQYASNLMAELVADGSGDFAVKVRNSCEQHLSSKEGRFCSGFSELVRRHADHSQVVRFCSLQYELMHGLPKGHVAPANPSPPSSNASELRAPPRRNSSRTASAAATRCEKHLLAIDQLKLTRARAISIVRLDCPRRFNTSPSTCLRVGRLFAGGHVHEACRLAVSSQVVLNVTAVCERTASAVVAVGLEGEALKQAAADLCVKELVPGVTPHQARAGCHLFARRLEVELQSSGPLDVPRFCTGLTGPAAPRDAAAPVMRSVKLHETTSARKSISALQKVQLRGVKPPGNPPSARPSSSPPTKHSSDEQPEDFLSGFLQRYDNDGAEASAPSVVEGGAVLASQERSATDASHKKIAPGTDEAEEDSLKSIFMGFAVPTTLPPASHAKHSERKKAIVTPAAQASSTVEADPAWAGGVDNEIDSVVVSFLGKAS